MWAYTTSWDSTEGLYSWCIRREAPLGATDPNQRFGFFHLRDKERNKSGPLGGLVLSYDIVGIVRSFPHLLPPQQPQ